MKTAAEGGFEVKRDELDWSAIKQEFEELFGSDDTITVDPSSLERKFTIPERNHAIVDELRKVLDKGFVGKDGVKRAPLIGKTIVFVVTKRHAETLAQMFDQEFADKKPDPANAPRASMAETNSPRFALTQNNTAMRNTPSMAATQSTMLPVPTDRASAPAEP